MDQSASSNYDEILDIFEIGNTSISPIKGPMHTNPTPMPEGEVFDTMHDGDKFAVILEKRLGPLESIRPISTRPSLEAFDECEFINLSSSKEVYDKIIMGTIPDDHESFSKLIEAIKPHLKESLNEDEISNIADQLGLHSRSLVSEIITKWMTNAHTMILDDKKRITTILDVENSKLGDSRRATRDERIERLRDRDIARDVLFNLIERHKLCSNKVRNLSHKISMESTKTIVLSKHEQLRAKHKERYESVMARMEAIAKGIHDTMAAIKHYSGLEIECSTSLNHDLSLVSLDSI